jgi:hypothetical protein
VCKIVTDEYLVLSFLCDLPFSDRFWLLLSYLCEFWSGKNLIAFKLLICVWLKRSLWLWMCWTWLYCCWTLIWIRTKQIKQNNNNENNKLNKWWGRRPPPPKNLINIKN